MNDPFMAISACAVTVSIISLVVAIRPTKRPLITGAICPCKHAINYHDKLSGRCKAVMLREPVQWGLTASGASMPTAWREFFCDCQVYAGPELIRGATGQPLIPLPEIDDRG